MKTKKSYIAFLFLSGLSLNTFSQETNCLKWSSNGGSLQDAININMCVEIQNEIVFISDPLIIPFGHVLKGKNKNYSTIEVDPTQWNFHCCDAMVSDPYPDISDTEIFTLKDITLDGSGVATYNVCCRNFTVTGTTLKNARCSGIGVAGKKVIIKSNTISYSGHTTFVPGRGDIDCSSGNLGGVEEGAGIYTQSPGQNLGTIIYDNVIEHNFGPALDVNGSHGGSFFNNIIGNNRGWAAVSLYGASGWIVHNNNITHPKNEPPQPYHPYCAGGPNNNGNPAGIFLCQNTDDNGLVTNDNVFVNNSPIDSHYGILSIGADEVKPYWAPRNNSFINNNVSDSTIGCADDFQKGQWFNDKNIWFKNNCNGDNTGPEFF